MSLDGQNLPVWPTMGWLAQSLTLIGLPTIVVLVLVAEQALPIGLQIIAAPWRETDALWVAQQLEGRGGGRQIHPVAAYLAQAANDLAYPVAGSGNVFYNVGTNVYLTAEILFNAQTRKPVLTQPEAYACSFVSMGASTAWNRQIMQELDNRLGRHPNPGIADH